MSDKSLIEVAGEAVTAASEAEKAKWDTIGKGIDVGSGLGRFLERVFGPALIELGGIGGDRVRFWRLMQAQKLAAKFETACQARGITDDQLKSLPLSQTVPLIEAASMEDSDEVQQLWAELLASAMDARSGITIKKVYLAILKEIGPAEVALLDLLFRFGPNRTILMAALAETAEKLNSMAEERWRRFPQNDRLSALANLRRLGCVSPDVAAPQLRNLIQPIRINGVESHGWGQPPQVNSVNPAELQKLIQWMLDTVLSAAGSKATELPDSIPLHHPALGSEMGRLPVPEFGLLLTPLGRDLMRACFGPADA